MSFNDPNSRKIRANLQRKARTASTRRSKKLLASDPLGVEANKTSLDFNKTLQSRLNLEKALNRDMIKASKQLEKTVAGFSGIAFAGKALNKVLGEVNQFTGAIEKGFKKNIIPVLNSLEVFGEVLGRPFLGLFEEWAENIDDMTNSALIGQDIDTIWAELNAIFKDNIDLAEQFADAFGALGVLRFTLARAGTDANLDAALTAAIALLGDVEEERNKPIVEEIVRTSEVLVDIVVLWEEWMAGGGLGTINPVVSINNLFDGLFGG